MENLAGRLDCDRVIKRELEKAKIDVVQHPGHFKLEVPASVTGKLGEFTFQRKWNYWEVKGKVPLEAAKEMFIDPNGREDVRVDGFAGGCLPPERKAEHYDADGKRLLPLTVEVDLRRLEDGADYLLKKMCKDMRDSSRFVEDPAKEAARSVVTLYHIDTQEGLNLFTQTLRKYNAVPSEEK
jgi:hypothetical protein